MSASELLKALAVTAEVCGAEMTPAAARIMAEDLAAYPLEAVLRALTKVRREHQGRLTLAAIITRIDDGRPSVEVAWAMIPKDEYDSAVLTHEMGEALTVAQPLLNAGDTVAARMAFKEAYTKAVERARDEQRPVQWRPSAGWDQAGRAAVFGEAVKKGWLELEQVEHYVEGQHKKDLLSIAGYADRAALEHAMPSPKVLELIRK